MGERPIRVQRSRAKGWKMPPNTVYVGRPTIYGNPFTIKAATDLGYRFEDEATAADFARQRFMDWARGSSKRWAGPESERRRSTMLEGLPQLRGKNLACWCSLDRVCHADILLALANAPEPRDA